MQSTKIWAIFSQGVGENRCTENSKAFQCPKFLKIAAPSFPQTPFHLAPNFHHESYQYKVLQGLFYFKLDHGFVKYYGEPQVLASESGSVPGWVLSMSRG